jgi:hypothetical protein
MNFKPSLDLKNIKKVAQELEEKGVILCMGDKSGKFALIKGSSYEDKWKKAIEKNFLKVEKKTSGIGESKKEVMRILRENGEDKLAGTVNTASVNWLTCFTSVKTHKVLWPLRIIVTARNSWLGVVSSFIQSGFKKVTINDPWRDKNSEETVLRMSRLHKRKVKIFSLDIEDMYFNVNIETVLRIFKQKVIEKGEGDFVREMGVSLDDFIEIVRLYFKNTIIEKDGDYFTQRKGACIGSKAAPIVSEIFLEFVDEEIRKELIKVFGELIEMVIRFVDDYWLAVKEKVKIDEVVRIFNNFGQGLVFTLEMEDEEKGLQFLDTRGSTKNGGLCWECKQRSPKPLLPWISNHAREIKESVVTNCLKTVVTRACPCGMKESLEIQEGRLSKAGYPLDFVQNQKLKVLKNWDKPKKDKESQSVEENDREKFVGIQRYHKLTHKIGKIASRWNVKVMSRYRWKNKNIIYMKKAVEKTEKFCNKKHKQMPFECGKGRIYSIGLSCKREYIGQTVKCVNSRLTEHLNGKASYSTFQDHRNICDCKVEECISLNKYPVKNASVRMILETLSIEKVIDEQGKDRVISNPSIHPSQKEREFINKKWKWRDEK